MDFTQRPWHNFTNTLTHVFFFSARYVKSHELLLKRPDTLEFFFLWPRRNDSQTTRTQFSAPISLYFFSLPQRPYMVCLLCTHGRQCGSFEFLFAACFSNGLPCHAKCLFFYLFISLFYSSSFTNVLLMDVNLL